MTQTITIKQLQIGKGIPKIVVPLVGNTPSALLAELSYLKQCQFDLVEWRLDHFTQVDDMAQVLQMAEQLRQQLPNIPILATFRTQQEGGNQAITNEQYLQLNQQLASSGLIDLLDVELMLGQSMMQQLIKVAHQHQVYVIASNHDFSKTPSQETIVQRLTEMQQLGADIAKIAVMPQSPQDVLTLLSATYQMQQHATGPIVTMAMAGIGLISRLTGELFGSALTFGAAKQASAPGQISANDLRQVLQLLNQNR